MASEDSRVSDTQADLRRRLRRPYRPGLERYKTERDAAKRVLLLLDDRTLEHFWRLGHMAYSNDGFPTSSGLESAGSNPELTSVEQAAINRAYGRMQQDLMGGWLRTLFDDLFVMGATATHMYGLAQLIVDIKPVGRERLTPPCIVCGEDALPRPKRGMCEKHYKTWERAGKPAIVIDSHTGRYQIAD